MLVPGFTGSKEDFVAVLAPLAAAGWRVVTYDQRGQHETPGAPPPGEVVTAESYALSELALDLLAIVAATRIGAGAPRGSLLRRARLA